MAVALHRDPLDPRTFSEETLNDPKIRVLDIRCKIPHSSTLDFSCELDWRSEMSKRDEYVNKLKGQLDQWNAEVATWEAKARKAQAGARAEYEKRLKDLRHQRDQALEHMKRVQAATGDAWLDLVRGADDAWAKMREAFDKARAHFNK